MRLSLLVTAAMFPCLQGRTVLKDSSDFYIRSQLLQNPLRHARLMTLLKGIF